MHWILIFSISKNRNFLFWGFPFQERNQIFWIYVFLAMKAFLTIATLFPVSLKSWFTATDVGAISVLAFSVAMAIVDAYFAFIDI